MAATIAVAADGAWVTSLVTWKVSLVLDDCLLLLLMIILMLSTRQFAPGLAIPF